MHCPNINSPEWKDLISKVPVPTAYELWDRYEGNVPESAINNSGDVVDTTGLKQATDKLDSTMKTILVELGISYEAVDEILSAEGEATKAVAKADLAKRAIQVVEGKADATTLTEETVHFLIEMLDKNSHVYQSMFNQITKYGIFDEVVKEYGNTPGYTQDRLRKEAMAKLITRELVDNAEGQTSLSPREQKTFFNWWNMLLAKLKQVVKNFNSEKLDKAIEEYSPFKEIAYKIANKDLDIFNQDIEDSHTYYQLSNAPNEKQKAALEKINIASAGITREGTDATRGYYKEGKKLGKSVTTKRDEKMGKKYQNSTRSPEQEALLKESGRIGTLVHDDMDNISKRILSKDKGVAKVVKTNNAIYAKLENYANQLLKVHGEDAIYLSEQMVYDPTTDTPGTIDLIVIDKEGTTHIYDWKTMTFKQIEKKEYGEPARWKTESYEYQLNAYKNILESAGIKDFGKRRYVPIETVFTKNKATGQVSFSDVNIGTPTGTRVEGKTYLNPVPVSNEKTGEESLDNLISQLLALYKKINARKSVSPVEVAKKRQQLMSLNRSIRDLQLNKNLGSFADTAELQFKAIEARLAAKKTPLSEAELVDMKEQLQVYTDLSSKFAALYRDDKIPADHIKKFDALAGKANRLDITVKELLEKHFRDVALKTGLSEDALDTFKKKGAKPIGLVDKLTRNLSRIDHPVFRTFWNLVNKAKTQVKRDTDVLEKEISDKLDALKQEAATEGLKGTDIFNSMVDKKSGKLISKHSPEFYKLRKEKIAKGDWQWLRDNSVVDEAGLKKYIEEQQNFIKKYIFSSDPKTNEFIRKGKLQDIHNRLDIFNNPQAYASGDSFLNRFVKPSDKWLSNEYKNLKTKKAAFAFYSLFTSKMKEFGEFMPLGSENNWVNTDRFIPNLKADLIERGMNLGGEAAVGGLGKNVVDMLDYNYNEEMSIGDINEFTGEFERRVPVYYTKQIDPKEKSYDLGRVLYMFGNKAYNYKYMNEVEGSIRNLRNVLADSGESLVDANGKVLKNILKDSKTISADTLTTFDDFVNYYVYGVKEKDNGSISYKKKVVNPKTGEVEYEEVQISKNKATKGLLKAFATKALGLNLISGGAQIFGNNVNSIVLAMGGQHFNLKQWGKAKAEVTSGNFNPEVYQFLQVLDIRGDNQAYKKADSLSVNDTARQANLEKAFFLYEYGDNALFKTVSVAFIQNHGIDANGKVVSLKKLPEGSKSIRELLALKENGTSNITDLISEEEYRKMRNKIQSIGEKITGMSNRDNINGWRLNVAGQALMQFRGWIPRTLATRFQGARYDAELELVEKGRYISLVQEIVYRRILPITRQLLGAATAGQFAANSEDYIDTLYNKFMEENPHLSREEVTREMFYETHVANVKSGLMEVALYMAFFLLIGGLKEGWDDDDDEDKRFKSETMRTLNRFSDEIGFYLNPNSFQAITKGAVPAIGLFTDIGNFFGDIFGEAKGRITDDEVAIHNNKPLWRFARTFIPGGSTMWNWFGDKSKLKEKEED